MKKVLIICFSNLKRDPRVYRQILNLKDEYKVTTVGFNDSEIEGVSFIPTEKPEESLFDYLSLKLGLYEKVYWKRHLIDLKNRLLKEKFDVIIANDLDTLPLAVKIAQGAKLIYDAHEYFPRQKEEDLYWRIFYQDYIEYLCSTYMPKADRMFTVSQGLAEEYQKNYDVTPVLFTNAAEYNDIRPVETGDKIKIIYHGVASKERGTEAMIELAGYLDNRFALDFMVLGKENYIKNLIKKAENNPKIRFLPPVQRQELVRITNNYDIGLFLFKDKTCFSYQNALPNKFFEYIQARLMLAIGPSREMAKFVKQYGCGIVSDSFNPKELAEKINSLTKEDILRYKYQSDKAAKELNSENNIKMLKDTIKNL